VGVVRTVARAKPSTEQLLGLRLHHALLVLGVFALLQRHLLLAVHLKYKICWAKTAHRNIPMKASYNPAPSPKPCVLPAV